MLSRYKNKKNVLPIKKKRILALLSKNVPLRKRISLGYAPEKLAVQLYKRAIRPLGVSKTRSFFTAQTKKARMRRRLIQKIRRFRLKKLGLKFNLSPYTVPGRVFLQGRLSRRPKNRLKVPDDFFKVVPLSSQLCTTLGPGQHSRKYLSATVTSQLTNVNNFRFLHEFNESVPGNHPLSRMMGVFIRKGFRQKAHKLMKVAVAKFKVNFRKKVNHPYFFGKGFFKGARTTTIPSVLYLLQSALHKTRSPFRFISYKVAAFRKKMPVLNNIPKSYSIVFNYIKNHLPTVMSEYKNMQKPLRPYNISTYYPFTLGRHFAEALVQKGRLADLRALNLLDAKDNMSNMRFGPFRKKRKRRRFK